MKTHAYSLLYLVMSANACLGFFLSSSSRRISARLVTRGLATSRPSRLRQSSAGLHLPRRFMSSGGISAVEEDLDAALDDILGDITADDKAEHMKDSQPMPPSLVEVVDLKDPNFLSTSNPRWIQAGIPQSVIDVLSSKGITKFTPVQAEAFDPVVAGRDVIGRSRTGTGKTLAFGLPSLARLVEHTEATGKRDASGRMSRGRLPSMVVLCPTRELARQVQEEIAGVARPLGLFTEVFHGGVSYDPQSRALRQGLDIVVGTPGRVIDHIQRGNLDLSECAIVVLDE
jgi:ATP-dependent RNA helicase DDX21